MKAVKNEVVTTPEPDRKSLRGFMAHPFGLPVALFVVLVLMTALVAGVLIWHDKRSPIVHASENYVVIVRHDDEKQIVPTNAKTVGDLLNRMHIEIDSSDRVEPAVDQPITGDNFLVNVYRSAPIAIVDGSGHKLVNSAAATARSVVTETGTTLYAEDTVDSGLTTNFVLQKSLGYRAVIDRATPMTLQLYGQPLSLRTHAKTVAELLKEKGIKLGKDDTLRPSAATAVTTGMEVVVVRNGVQVITLDEDIPAPVQNIIDASLSFGSSAVRQEGSPGKVTNTYQIKVENGYEISRTLLQSVRVREPVTRIVAKGNTVNIPADKQAVMAAAGVSTGDYGYVDYIFSRESHWNAAAMSSNGYAGLGQTRPATLSAACPSWQTDPVCQTRFFSGYAQRYGGWAGAYNAWISKGWW